MRYNLTIATILSIFLFSCKDKQPTKKETPTVIKNKGLEIVSNMVQKVGNYNKLLELKDVVYTYKYETPDGKADISTEKYIFNGELSYGLYHQNERTLTDLKAPIEQGYDGHEFWLKNNGNLINDEKSLKRVAFNRPTNFYWFTMFQKLLDPGLNYEYLGEKNINNKNYDIVKITFDSQKNKPTDIYQLYINKTTLLVDQFLFTVADFGVIETPFLMELEYEKINGLLIPSKRKYKKSTWNADVTDKPWINVTWTNIKFNNNLSRDLYKK